MTEAISETIPYKRESDKRKRVTLVDLVLVSVLMVLALVLRGYNVDKPKGLFFDEIYYVDAAKRLWKGQDDPNSVHPPLAKWLIAGSIKATKEIGGADLPEERGWRAGSVLCGVLMVGATYGFALTVFSFNRPAAVAAAFVVATEHLHLTMSRIAMLDPYLALFCLLGAWGSFAYFRGHHERWAVLGAFSLGLATGCKWSGLFTAFGCFLACLWIDWREHMEYSRSQRYFCWLLLLVPLGFFLSYTALFQRHGLEPDSFKLIFAQGERMVKFRADPEQFVHGYKSYFWDWPLVFRPIWLHYIEPVKDTRVEGICSMGVWWTWWLFTVLLLERAYTGLFKKKDTVAAALVLLWVGQWLPWAASTTGGFFYYMLPQVPVMGLLLGKWFADLADFDDALGEGRYRAWILALVYVLGFVLYYPFAAGLNVHKDLFRALFFLPGWI